MTINTGVFTLSGADIASGNSNGGSLSFAGGSLISAGTFRGGNAAAAQGNGIGGTGISLANGSLDNLGTVTGGTGGNTLGLGTTAGAGGIGASLTGSTLVNEEAITGGTGGSVNANNSGSNNPATAGAGGAGIVMSGGSLDNRDAITGGMGGTFTNSSPGADNRFGGAGGLGASLTGGTHVNTGTIIGGMGGIGANAGASGHGASGGGLSLSDSASLLNSGTIIGANGRAGGINTGGGGTPGGFGASLANSSLVNDGAIAGGTGGGSGAGGVGAALTTGSTLTNNNAITGGTGGTTGAGGVGMTMVSGSTLVNSGSISGGNGNGTASGGIGITASGGVRIVNDGSISGGLAGNGVTRALAIQMGGGGNVLELHSNYAITGNVSSLLTTNNTIALGGAADGSFNAELIGPTAQFRNFGIYQMIGAGTWTLTGATTFKTPWQLLSGALSVSSEGNLGSTAGALTFNGGTLQVTGTGFTGTTRAITWGPNGGGFDIVDPANTFVVSQALTGGGPLTLSGAGTLVLAGANSYSGPTNLLAGTLTINGDQSAATGLTTVASGATLAGKGTIGGSVQVADNGTIAPGNGGSVSGTLTILQDLSLSSASNLDYHFGEAGVVNGAFNDHLNVGGKLVLDGTLNVAVAPGGAFEPGIYRVISYNGALTNNGLNVGIIPSPDFFVQTSIPNQVNLVNTAGLTLNFWDGAAGGKHDGKIDGGDGVWQSSAGNDSWTTMDGTVNAPFKDAAFAIFAGSPGTVVVDNSLGQVTVTGMQFATSGYLVQGEPIALVGPSAIIRVGDGMAEAAAYVATIAADLVGPAALVTNGTGTLILTGNNTYAGGTTIKSSTLQVSADANLGAPTGGLTLDGGTLHTTGSFGTGRTVTLAGTGTFAPDAGTALTLTAPVAGPGSLVLNGPGELVLAGPASYLGDTTVAAGTLSAGATNALNAASAHSVLAGATLNLNGFDQTVLSLSNAGTVALNGSPGTTLTVTGEYAGAGGLLQLNTTLHNDASPTDRLAVLGNTSGSTNLKVTNIGGTGPPGVEGIKVVDVGGASDGVFVLQGDYVFHGEQALIGGAYAYTLQKNGVSTPGDGDWYLRSALKDAPPGVPPGPIFQPGVALYESYPQILLSLISLPTLRERTGNRTPGTAGPANAGPAMYPAMYNDGASYLGGPAMAYAAPAPVGVDAWWGRVDARRISLEPSSSTAGATYDADQVRLQTGVDALLYANPSGKLIGGFTVQHGTSWAHVSSVWGNGKINTESYGLGGSLTWYGLNGVYVDGQAQLHWFDTDIRSSLAGTMTEGDSATGYGLSVETGKRFAFGRRWALTPQAQLSYTDVDFDFTDPFGASVSARSSDSLLGRLGLALDYGDAWSGASGPALSRVYGIANLYYEFLDGTAVDVSGTRLQSGNDELWGGIGAGGSLSWSGDKYAIYGEVSLNTSLENFADSYSVNGTAGFRIRW